ncbi:unnamed protein product [Chondrus crispus]|uniref:Uncharacterized protein n=1 Tax=Chondrus crispus TaxID=2769 RepID=R7Q896_CHOCR|nr:unnamed protein product [Chondrus crispus]CDF34003.1 unnamed protein product [Chondrus crispus]|eukprot:XP_005713822.1 unnamed protein product [Chondrus crispus]
MAISRDLPAAQHPEFCFFRFSWEEGACRKVLPKV